MCESSPSVPPAALHWVVVQDNKRVEYSPVEKVDQLEDGSWRTSSSLEFVVEDTGDVVVECYAKHEVLGEDSRAFAHVILIGEWK